jgi:hypothetical protein
MAMIWISYLLLGNSLVDIDSLILKYDLPVYIFLIMGVMLFLVYDTVYSVIIKYIYGFIKKNMKDGGGHEKNSGDT